VNSKMSAYRFDEATEQASGSIGAEFPVRASVLVNENIEQFLDKLGFFPQPDRPVPRLLE
jgi:hypothetical protein